MYLATEETVADVDPYITLTALPDSSRLKGNQDKHLGWRPVFPVIWEQHLSSKPVCHLVFIQED
jgi:hypothetical protein